MFHLKRNVELAPKGRDDFDGVAAWLKTVGGTLERAGDGFTLSGPEFIFWEAERKGIVSRVDWDHPIKLGEPKAG